MRMECLSKDYGCRFPHPKIKDGLLGFVVYFLSKVPSQLVHLTNSKVVKDYELVNTRRN